MRPQNESTPKAIDRASIGPLYALFPINDRFSLVGQPANCLLTSLPQIPCDARGPVFAEPWEAQAFALAVQLSGQGHFTWTEWAAALSDELRHVGTVRLTRSREFSVIEIPLKVF
jgi:hypothetical protein